MPSCAPLSEPGKYADGEVPGLYLQVQPRASSKAASKYWWIEYRLHGKEDVYAITRYPDIGLEDARKLARNAHRNVANHVAPLKAKREKTAAQLLKEGRPFQYIAEQWLAFKSPDLVSDQSRAFVAL